MATGVTESSAGFEYIETERGINATRVFFYDPTSIVEGPDFPKIGDTLVCSLSIFPQVSAAVLQGVYCRQINWSQLAGHPDKLQMTASYTNEPIDSSVFSTQYGEPPTNIDDLPTTIEFSGEYATLNFTKDNAVTAGWTWEDTGKTVAQPVSFRVNSSTMRITRYIPTDKFDDFKVTSSGLIGKVNNNTFQGGGKGCVLYTGCSTEMFNNGANQKYWKVDFEFLFRNPDGANYDGWQLILRMDGKWAIPLRADKTRIYEEGDFSNLFK